MSQVNNHGIVNKRLSNDNYQTNSSILSIDDDTELSSDLIKDQFDNVGDIVTQPILEVPTKRLLHLKEQGGNLFVSSSQKIYSKNLQKLVDRVLFTKSVNNDGSSSSTDNQLFQRVLSRTDDNDSYSTSTSLAEPKAGKILILGSTSTEHALVWKLSQRKNLEIFCSTTNSGILMEFPSVALTKNLENEKEILEFVEEKQIDLVIALNNLFYYEQLEAQLNERGKSYLGCSAEVLNLSENYLNAKEFMTKNQIPTLDWIHCRKQDEGEEFFNKYPNQQQWIIRSVTNQKKIIYCKTRAEALQTLKSIFQDKLFDENNPSVIIEHGYSFETAQICTVYIISDGIDDYTQIGIIESDPLGFGAYGPCPYLTKKQLAFIRRRIIERTLQCCPKLRHLFGFHLLIQGNDYNQICLLDYKSTFDEPDSEILLYLSQPDVFLQYAFDLSLTINKKRPIHCVNTAITSKIPSIKISKEILLEATKNNKVKIFHNQANVKLENDEIIRNGEGIFNVLGYGSTLEEAQIQSIRACEYIKQNTNIKDLSFKTDIASQAIEWYKTHGNDQYSLTNGKKKKVKPSAISGQMDGQDNPTSEDEEENEPMDFDRAFGHGSDMLKKEPMDIEQNNGILNGLNTYEGETYFDLKNLTESVLVSTTADLTSLADLFNLNDSESIYEYLGYESIIRCVNDLICAQPLYVQSCSLPITTHEHAVQYFYHGIQQACQQINCTYLKPTSISSSAFNTLCTGVCNRDFLGYNNTKNLMINDGDFLIGLRCNSNRMNSQGYVKLKELFQKKNIHLNDKLPFRDESFLSLLLQKSSVLSSEVVKIINQLVLNRTIKIIRYLKDVGLSRTLESLLGSSIGTLAVQLDGQQWPTMPPISTWIYQNSGFSQDDIFEYFNCGIDYLIIIDHTKSSIENIVQQLKQSFFLGTFSSMNSSPIRNKSIRVNFQTQPQTIQLKNISFKPTNSTKDQLKQSITNDKTRCAILISTNDSSLLSLLEYSSTAIDCSYEIVLILSTLSSLSDIARVNESYPSVVTKVMQPKKYAARNYDLDQKIDDELQLHGCELVILDHYACRLSSSFIQAWHGRLINIYPSLLPSFRHSTSPIRDALQTGVRITGVTVYFLTESDKDNDGQIITQESLHIKPNENDIQLENRLRILEQQIYPKAIEMVTSGKVICQEKKRVNKANIAPTIATAIY